MKRFSRFLPIAAGAIAGGAIALIVAGGGASHSTTTTVVEPAHGAALPTALSSGKGLTVNQIYKSASPGVVDILVTSTSSGGNLFGGTQQTQGEGAGVVFDKQGDIVTDQHVVANANTVKVSFQDGRTASAKVLGTDPSTDVAVIHVDVPASELHPIPFTNSSAAQVGDPVVAIGSPFSLPETTTAGIVSQTGRSITAPNNYTISAAIQTDAAINPGNSGGPLLDAAGQVLGLNDQIETNNSTATGEGSSSGVGFAIPSNTVTRIANTIIAGKAVKHAYLGVELSSSSAGGALVSQLSQGAPAQAAGIRTNDLITAIDGKPVSSTDQFIATIDTYSPGDTITLTVKRGGSTSQIKVKLATRPAQAPGATQQIP
jgi:S1-C subfamily serine protease